MTAPQITWNKYCDIYLRSLGDDPENPPRPTSKQLAFLMAEKYRDVFYGGSAGGGKSVALLLSALQFVHIQGYTALIVRRSHQDLAKPKAIMDMAKTAFLGTHGVRWSEKNKEFLFPEGGRLLFAYMDGPNDHLFLKGTELQFVGADEASDLRWNQVNYLKSRMRQVKNRDIPLRFRAASNPGGRSHGQLYNLYIDPDTREDRIFIPAGLNDNPYLDADEYRLMLKDLDPVTRAQLEFGDWNVRDSGGYFDREWFGKSVPMAPKKARRVRWWDLASTEKDDNNDPDYTAGALLAMDDDGIVYIEDIINVQYSPMRVETLIRQTAEADGMGVDIWMEQEPGAAGKTTISHYSRKVLPDFSFHGERSTGPKEEYIKSLSSSVEQRNVKLVATPGRPCVWMARFLEQAEVWPNDNYHDDMIDATSKAFCKLASSKKKVGVWGRRRGNR